MFCSPFPRDRVQLLRSSDDALCKSDESTYAIVPSQMSKSTQDEYIDGGVETEMTYRPLSCENVLFAAWAYKRNYRNKT